MGGRLHYAFSLCDSVTVMLIPFLGMTRSYLKLDASGQVRQKQKQKKKIKQGAKPSGLLTWKAGHSTRRREKKNRKRKGFRLR
jgi:hypothetical protein